METKNSKEIWGKKKANFWEGENMGTEESKKNLGGERTILG